MSDDNYMLIRPHGGKFVVTMEFASDGIPVRAEDAYREQRGKTRIFDTLGEARDYAHSEYTEYGVEENFVE